MQTINDQKSVGASNLLNNELSTTKDEGPSPMSVTITSNGQLVSCERPSKIPKVSSISNATPLATTTESSGTTSTQSGQSFIGCVKVGGTNNQIGMPRSLAEKMVEKGSQITIQRFEKNVTISDNSNGNKVGIH